MAVDWKFMQTTDSCSVSNALFAFVLFFTGFKKTPSFFHFMMGGNQ